MLLEAVVGAEADVDDETARCGPVEEQRRAPRHDGAGAAGHVEHGELEAEGPFAQRGEGGRVEDADPVAREGLRQIHAWYTSYFAEAVAKMRAIDEGGSSLLDNTLLLYSSYMADGGEGRHK